MIQVLAQLYLFLCSMENESIFLTTWAILTALKLPSLFINASSNIRESVEFQALPSLYKSSAWCGHRDLNSGRRLGKQPSVSWLEARKDFMAYLKGREYNERTAKDMVSYLNKYTPVLNEPLDVIALFSKVTASKRHVILGLRVLLNFYEAIGYNKAFLNSLRAAIPNVQCGIDLKIPSELKIKESLKKLSKAPVKYQALYSLLVDSGLRLVEGVELINNFREVRLLIVSTVVTLPCSEERNKLTTATLRRLHSTWSNK